MTSTIGVTLISAMGARRPREREDGGRIIALLLRSRAVSRS
jgi:hypothetical protein